MSQEEWILEVVKSFYDKARTDVLIGYHFRHIQDFESHIPRIAVFWEVQLLGATSKEVTAPFDVMKAHDPLPLKKGELGRWMVLMQKTLEESVRRHPEHLQLKTKWEERLKFFEGVFSRFYGI